MRAAGVLWWVGELALGCFVGDASKRVSIKVLVGGVAAPRLNFSSTFSQSVVAAVEPRHGASNSTFGGSLARHSIIQHLIPLLPRVLVSQKRLEEAVRAKYFSYTAA